jgi:hypothetical protein
MSRSVDLICIDCRNSLGVDINRGYDACASLWFLRETLADLATTRRGLPPFGDLDLEVSIYGRPVDLDWFVEHRGHELAVVDEYGHRMGWCCEWLPRGEQGENGKGFCSLLFNHEGRCR